MTEHLALKTKFVIMFRQMYFVNTSKSFYGWKHISPIYSLAQFVGWQLFCKQTSGFETSGKNASLQNVLWTLIERNKRVCITYLELFGVCGYFMVLLYDFLYACNVIHSNETFSNKCVAITITSYIIAQFRRV